MSRHIHISTILAIIIYLVSTFANAQSPIRVTKIPTINQEGHFKLTWEIDTLSSATDVNFFVQQDNEPSFQHPKKIYQGPDLATYISGLPNGKYFYRVKIVDSQNWSEVVVVDVKHHPLSLAYSLFGVGLLVFVSTIAVILYGMKKENKIS